MGTSVRIVVCDGDPAFIDRGFQRIAELESRWTRFDRMSELSRLNRAAGATRQVSADLFELVERAVAAWTMTSGAFDPTVHDAIVALGYDRTIREVRRAPNPPRRSRLAPGCAGVELDAARRTVRLPVGVAIDPGGIGKGLAADLVAADLHRCGAAGVLVDVGGDLRTIGRAPDPAGWVLAVDHGRGDIGRFALPTGGVATSSVLGRRWRSGADEVHHVLDPATGRPTGPVYDSVTVVAPSAAAAEIAATSVLVHGRIDAPGTEGGLVLATSPTGARHGAPELLDLVA